MKKVKINRLFHGKASVRDYLVQEAFNRKENLLVILENSGEMMIVPWNELHKGKRNPERFKSKHDDRFYSLIDYEWKSSNKQEKLF